MHTALQDTHVCILYWNGVVPDQRSLQCIFGSTNQHLGKLTLADLR